MIFTYFDPVNVNNSQVTNIFKNYRGYITRVLPNYRLRTYYIKGSPRPEQLAHDLYGNQELYWLLLYLNNVYDPFYGWLTDQETSYQQALQRYENAGGVQVAYHVDAEQNRYYNLVEHPTGSGNWYDKGDVNFHHLQYSGPLAPIDTLEQYTRMNEDKRTIKIIAPEDMTRFMNDLIKEMSTGL